MAKACIYSIEPVEHGGVPAKVRIAKNILDRYGHEIDILFTATEQVPTGSRWGKLLYFLKTPLPYKAKNLTSTNFKGTAVPHYPLPIWITNMLPAFIARRAFANHDIHFVISGSNHVGWPATKQSKPFLVWIGTLYQEELAGRAARGNEWAKRMQSGRNREQLDQQEAHIFEKAALILSNGGHTAQQIQKLYPFASDKTRVAIYPVDTDYFHPSDEPRQPFLLFTARINDERKDALTLFNVLGLVRQTHPNMRLKLTGNKPADYISKILQDSGQADYVDFLGPIPDADLAQLYRDASAFVLSSNQEGLGIVMLEAMASGLPTVSTKCGGPESVIIDGETGFLVDVGDADAMATRILQILDDESLAAQLSENSRAFAIEHFSLQSAEKNILNALRDVYPEHFRD